jgi:hypothetical protein
VIRWPWTRNEPDHEGLTRARQQLAEARDMEPRTRRVAKEVDRAIARNHFAADIKQALEGR